MIRYIIENYSFKEFFVTISDEYIWSILKHIPSLEGVFLRRFYLKVLSQRCGKGVVIEKNVFIRCSSKLIIGDNVFINRDVHLAALGGINIGKNVAIGPKVVLVTNDHKFLTVGTNYRSRNFIKKGIKIGANSIIGANSFINPGVTIGDNCIIAAGTSVFVDIPDGMQVSGQVTDLYFRNLKKSFKNMQK